MEDSLTNGTTGEERTNLPVPMTVFIQNYPERPQSGPIIILTMWIDVSGKTMIGFGMKFQQKKILLIANSRLCLHSNQIIQLMILVFISVLFQVVLSVKIHFHSFSLHRC